MTGGAMKSGKRTRYALTAIVIVYAALAIGYSLATNLKGGPDETAHFIYIRSLAVQHTLPEISHVAVNSLSSTATHEAHQPPLYYLVMALPYMLLVKLGASTAVAWRILRILGISFGIAWIYSVYSIAWNVFHNERSALITTAFVALIPTSIYMAGVLSNDTMISMWFGWGIALTIGFMRDGALKRRSAIGLGIVIGAAILTKAQGFLLIPIFLLALLMAWFSLPPGKRTTLIVPALTVLLVSAAVSGFWIIRSLVVFGVLQPESLSNPVLKSGLLDAWGHWPELLAVVKMVCINTYGYFWTPYWLVQPFVNGPVYYAAIMLFSALPVLGLTMRIIFVRDLDLRVFGLLFVSVALVVVSWLKYILTVDFGANLQGRLFLTVAPALAILFVVGIQYWLRNRKVKLAAAGVCLAGLFICNLLVIKCILAYYSLGYG